MQMTNPSLLHVDGDAFFASCAQALNPKLKGKPVVIGAERGLATAVSYEAKKYGIKRGMLGTKISQLCPDCNFVKSDYEVYHLFSHRLFNIIKKFTPQVEKYSVDECFADLTGLRRPYNASYLEIARRIKQEIESDLGITVSVGLGPNKTIAKIGSEWNKPSGLVAVPGNQIHHYLKNLPLTEIWGIGSQTSAYLKKLGIKNSLEFAEKSEIWVKKHLTKPHLETWKELNGEQVFPLELGEKETYKSITRSRTFYPASNNAAKVFGELTKNLEKACSRLRTLKMVAGQVNIMLKTQTFNFQAEIIKLDVPTNNPQEISTAVKKAFQKMFRSRITYRATGVTMKKLKPAGKVQMSLFSSKKRREKLEQIYYQVDKLKHRYGSQIVSLASSLPALEDQSRKFNLPHLGTVN
jgi:DNA polymerase IV